MNTLRWLAWFVLYPRWWAMDAICLVLGHKAGGARYCRRCGLLRRP
jgi:hypothetical protein